MGGSAKGGGSSGGGSSWVLPSLQQGWQPQQRQQQQRPQGQSGGGGSVNAQQGGGRQAPAGGGKKFNTQITPEAIAMGKEMAKWGAGGAIAGPGGMLIGSGIGAWRERAKQKELRKDATHIYNHGEKRKFGTGAPAQGGSGELPQQSRADMKGRQLSGGEIPMRPGSSYGRYPPQGPPLRAGGSILTGGSSNDSSGFGDNDTSDDSWW